MLAGALICAWGLALPHATFAAAERAPPKLGAAAMAELRDATWATQATLRAYGPSTAALIGAFHAALAQRQLASAAPQTPLPKAVQEVLRRQAAQAQAWPIRTSLPPLARIYHLRAVMALVALGQSTALGDLLAPSQSVIEALTHLQRGGRDLVQAQAEAMAPRSPEIDPVWPGPIDEPLAQLRHLVDVMAEPPRAVTLDLQAEVALGAEGLAHVALRWPDSGPAAALQRLHIARRGGVAAASWGADVEVATGRYSEILSAAAWDVPPVYHVAAVSAFGVPSRTRTVIARRVGPTLAPPTQVISVALAPAYDSPDFYRSADAVAVQWHVSASDVPTSDWDAALASGPLQHVDHYAIYRLAPGDVVQLVAQRAQAQARHAPLPAPHPRLQVGVVDAGAETFLDRPPVAQLARGITHLVVAVGENNEMAWELEAGQSAPGLQVDLTPALRLAAAGAAAAAQPVRWEARRAEALTSPIAQAAALTALRRQSDVAQHALWRGFWRQTPAEVRIGWWREGAQLQSEAQRVQARTSLPGRLHAAALGAAKLALYIEAHRDVLAAIEQHWQLLDDAGRQAAQAPTWPGPWLPGPNFGPWRTAVEVAAAPDSDGPIDAPVPSGIDGLDAAGPDDARLHALLAERPEHVAAWWQSRDAAQVAAVNAWWAALGAQAQARGITAWLAATPPGVVDSLAWPPWAHLTSQEQDAWLAEPPPEVPAKLWPKFLAHVDFETLPLATRVHAVREDVGPRRALMSQLRYVVRPCDAALEFELPAALAVLAAGLLVGCAWRFAGARERA